jgi:tetratricopeptide (TPR) repeat protein
VKRALVLAGALLLGAAGLLAWRFESRGVEAPPRTGTPAPPPEAGASDADALSLSRNPGPVADAGGVLSHFGHILATQAETFDEDLGIEVHVATFASPERSAEALAPEVFDLRAIGKKAPTGGLLVLLNPARREARIEVSYALEAVLPDALVGRIAHDQLAPYAASGMAGMAVMDALHFLKDFLTQQAIDGRLVLADSYRARPAFVERMRFLSGGAGSSVVWPSADELARRDFKAPIPPAERAAYAPGAEPLASAEALFRAYRDLAGDPSLELFTEGSRCNRRFYPVAPYEELQRARRLEDSRPWRVIEQGDYAVVTSDQRAPGFVPVLLQRTGGLWRVDLVETWKNLRFDRDGNYIVDNGSHPYGFGLAAFGSAGPNDVEAWDLGEGSLEEVIARLEATPGALYEYLLAEVLFRNCFTVEAALEHYEQAVREAPKAPLFQESLGRRAEFVAFPDLAIEAYGKLGDAAAYDLALAYAGKGDARQALHFAQRALALNPYDSDALQTARAQLEALGDDAGAREIAARQDALARAPERKELPATLRFDPPRPILEIGEPTKVDGATVYDHSQFSVTLENPSRRPIEILRVNLISAGTGARSGLGDIRSYWSYPSGPNRLAAGEAVTFGKTWGFTVDSAHEQLSYIFELCWRGENDVKQCRSQRVDLFPH